MSRVHSPQAAHTHRAAGPAVLDLIERLEKAEAGDVALNCAVARVFGYHVPDRAWSGWHDPDGKHIGLPPAFTTSLDAALALAERVLPGCFCGVQKNRWAGKAWTAYLTVADAEGEIEQDADTPALALCIAVLRATTPAEADAVGTSEASAPLQSPETPEGRESTPNPQQEGR